MSDDTVVIDAVTVRYQVRGRTHEDKPFVYEMGEAAFLDFVSKANAAVRRVQAAEELDPDRFVNELAASRGASPAELKAEFARIRAQQEPLPPDAERVLREHLWDLYTGGTVTRREHEQIQQVGVAPCGCPPDRPDPTCSDHNPPRGGYPGMETGEGE